MSILLSIIISSVATSYAEAPSAEDLMGDGPLLPLFENDNFDLGPDGIVNGSVAYSNSEVVILGGVTSQGYGFSFCSGTLISEKWVVTAAHCVEGMDQYEDWGYDLFVAAGTNVFTSGYEAFAYIRRSYEHPDYNSSNLVHDIGLLELESAITNIAPAVLNDDSVNGSWVGEEMTFVGFGITGDGREDSGTKRITEIPVINYDSNIIYSYSPTTNICSGDSGGAAFEQVGSSLELAGINSFGYSIDGGYPDCEGGANGVTRVDTHINWILGYEPDVLLSSDDWTDETTETTETTDTTDTTTETTSELTVEDGNGTDQENGQQTVTTTTTYGCVGCSGVGGTPGSAGWLLGLFALVPFVRRHDSALS